MSNSFTSPPLLTDASRVTASQTIRTTEFTRLADSSNYAFAVGGTSNLLSQTWDDSTFRQNSTTFVEMCQWYIPQISEEHATLNIILNGFCAVAGAQVRFTYTLASNSYTTTLTITDTSRYSSGFVSGAINITAQNAVFAGVLSMEVKAPTGGEVEILGVMANWSPLTSPLSTGQLRSIGSLYTPQGQNRLAADLPLSARTGVEMINNISMLRRRPRVLFNWSGVEGVSSSEAISVAGAAPRTIATGDLESMYSEAAIFPGMRDDFTLDIFAYVHVIQNGGTYSNLSLDLLGQQITMNSTGWTSHTLQLRIDELPRSDDFGLSVYRVGLDNTAHNHSKLRIYGNEIDGTSGTFKPYVAGLTIIGV